MDRLPIEEQTRLCIQATPYRIPDGLRPQSEPIDLTGVWQVETPEDADALLSGAKRGFVYRRDGHPNADSLGEILRNLHRADHAILTAQGMSALAAVALAILQPGDEVLLGQPVYGRCGVLFTQEMTRWNVRATEIPACDMAAWERSLSSRPKLAIVETITNPGMNVPDLRAIAKMCHGSGTILLVDNTFATPLLCRPLELGADLVMESLSKFVCGHSDAMLGLLCGTDRCWGRIRSTVSTFGLASSPLDCWLTRRGLATLQLRLERACSNAMSLASRLVSHPMVERVDYPGLSSHPEHEIAKSQFAGVFGNMIAIHLRGGAVASEVFIRAMKPDVPFCPSLGEAQTTLSHPCSTSHRSYSEHQWREMGISQATIRISTGIEDASWLGDRFWNGLEHLRNMTSEEDRAIRWNM